MTKVKYYEPINMSPEQRKVFIESGNPAILKTKDGHGVHNSNIMEVRPVYNLAEAETVIQGRNNAMIILGRDRPGDDWSGYGSFAASHSGCIDLIAGLSGPLVRSMNMHGHLIETNKSTVLDAARIYLSQRTDIDENFNCPPGNVGQDGGGSGIAIKADAVRIIARNGIKIISGADKFGARGTSADPQGIDLIGGGTSLHPTAEEMEPLVKGLKLVDALEEIIDMMADIQSNQIEQTLTDLIQEIIDALHFHVCAVGPGTPAPTAIAKVARVYFWIKRIQDAYDVYSAINMSGRVMRHKMKFYDETSEDYILSTWNHTN